MIFGQINKFIWEILYLVSIAHNNEMPIEQESIRVNSDINPSTTFLL